MPSRKNMSLILTLLFNVNRPISTRQIAKYLDVSWKTARENLEALFKLQGVEKGKVGKNKRIYWRTDEKIIHAISKKERIAREEEMDIEEDAEEFYKEMDRISADEKETQKFVKKIHRFNHSPRKKK